MADVKKFLETRFTDTREVFSDRIENYDIIRRHDLAVLNHCAMYAPFMETDSRGIERIKERLIPLVFATPRRKYGLEEYGYTAEVANGANDRTADLVIPYPGLSLTRLSLSFDSSRWTYAEWRKLAYSSDLNLVEVGNFPLPYNYVYQLDMWADSYHDLNMLTEQYARKFPRPTWWVDVEFPMPWGMQTIHMQTDGNINSTSVLEGGETTRELRSVATITLFGWIPLPTRWVRTANKITLEFIEESSNAILDSFSAVGDKLEFWNNGRSDQVLVWE